MHAPDYFSFESPQRLIDFLVDRGWVSADEQVSKITKAGEGNMNFVARVHTNQRTVIFKQSRPWVEKYPQIAAPAERIVKEVTFYQLVQEKEPLKEAMPALIAYDASHYAALFEDLGAVEDYTRLYQGERLSASELSILVNWLSALHHLTWPKAERTVLINRAMRALNHAHLFDIPLNPDNGLELDTITPGLAEEARRLQENTAYVDAVSSLGDRYLSDGPTLLHGDFYPGSWVHTQQGPKIIDPEFAFFGCAEYDVGVCMAHFFMAGYGPADVKALLQYYTAPGGFEFEVAEQFAGMEIMRRLIGVAQLPLSIDIASKRELLRLSEALVLGG